MKTKNIYINVKYTAHHWIDTYHEKVTTNNLTNYCNKKTFDRLHHNNFNFQTKKYTIRKRNNHKIRKRSDKPKTLTS